MRALLIGLIDEELDAADRVRLVELLRNDPAARTHYLRYRLTDAMLRLEHGTPVEWAAIPQSTPVAKSTAVAAHAAVAVMRGRSAAWHDNLACFQH